MTKYDQNIPTNIVTNIVLKSITMIPKNTQQLINTIL